VKSEMFEDRTPIWPPKSRKKPEAYPWRVEAEPILILPEEEFIPAEELATELEHVRKWPPHHWHLAFQGQLRTIGEADAELLHQRLTSKTSAARA
jgi:predicted RNA-binding protein